MMKKFKRIVTLFVVCLIVITSFTRKVLAQQMPNRIIEVYSSKEPGGRNPQAEQITINKTLINRNNVAICNESQNDIRIRLGEKDSALDTFLIKSNSIWYSKTYKQNHLIIKIQTGKYIVGYKLIPGKAYILFWRDNKKYWDLQKLSGE